jgi:hypothetical protein
MEKSKHENGDVTAGECANAHACSHWVFSKGWPHCSGCAFDKTRNTASEKSIPRLCFEMMVSFAVGSIAGLIAVDAALRLNELYAPSHFEFMEHPEFEAIRRLRMREHQKAHAEFMAHQLSPSLRHEK